MGFVRESPNQFFLNHYKVETLMRILIVEDHALMGAGLRNSLARTGFDPTWVKDGETALTLLKTESFLAMVLDISLPGMNGLEILEILRSEGNSMPVLVLTARDTTHDKVVSLDTGADDFLVKTTDMEELIARLRALIRRSGRGGRYTVGDLTMDVDARTVTQGAALLNLSNREFDVLRVFMEGAGCVITRTQLERALYGRNSQVESNTVEVHIHNLRAKIGANKLKTMRGIGYMLVRSIH
jgi:DNA-binding response OmpR family regulator